VGSSWLRLGFLGVYRKFLGAINLGRVLGDGVVDEVYEDDP